MARRVFNTSLAPDCILGQIQGNLGVKGWDLPQVAVDADPNTLDARDEEDRIHLSCQGDCEIRLPMAATLEIEAVHGDAQIKLLDDLIKVDAVHGNLALRNTASVQAGTIHGDFLARNVAGDLKIQNVLGDMDARTVEGDCTVDSAHGDFRLSDLRGALHIQVGGDVRLQLTEIGGDQYSIQAEGDVLCSLPGSAEMNFHLVSHGRSIKIMFAGINQNLDQEQFDLEAPGSPVSLTILAGGDIQLVELAPGRESGPFYSSEYKEQIARQVKAQIDQQMEEVSRRLQDQMDRLSEDLGQSGMSPDEAQRIVDQAMRASERETARAQEKMRRAQEKLERKLDENQRKADQKARAAERSSWTRSRHTWRRTWPTPPPAHQPPSEPDQVSDEEQLLILRMLEQKKITLDEAERLLQALEGSS